MIICSGYLGLIGLICYVVVGSFVLFRWKNWSNWASSDSISNFSSINLHFASGLNDTMWLSVNESLFRTGAFSEQMASMDVIRLPFKLSSLSCSKGIFTISSNAMSAYLSVILCISSSVHYLPYLNRLAWSAISFLNFPSNV
jgi:hypothetical protein